MAGAAWGPEVRGTGRQWGGHSSPAASLGEGGRPGVAQLTRCVSGGWGVGVVPGCCFLFTEAEPD